MGEPVLFQCMYVCVCLQFVLPILSPLLSLACPFFLSCIQPSFVSAIHPFFLPSTLSHYLKFPSFSVTFHYITLQYWHSPFTISWHSPSSTAGVLTVVTGMLNMSTSGVVDAGVCVRTSSSSYAPPISAELVLSVFPG